MKRFILSLFLLLLACGDGRHSSLPSEISSPKLAGMLEYSDSGTSRVAFEQFGGTSHFLGFYHLGQYVGFLGKDANGSMVLKIGSFADNNKNSVVITPAGFEIYVGVTQKAMFAYDGSIYVDGLKIIGSRQPDILNATSPEDAVIKLNQLLLELRNHGLIGPGPEDN